jgi:hypothetical protein
MDPMTIGIAAGLGKSLLLDGPKAERERKLAATTAELSPWTGMSPTMPKEADAFGSALQGGMAGAAFNQANPGFNAVKNPVSPEMSPAFDPSEGGKLKSAGMSVGSPKTFYDAQANKMSMNPAPDYLSFLNR